MRRRRRTHLNGFYVVLCSGHLGPVSGSCSKSVVGSAPLFTLGVPTQVQVLIPRSCSNPSPFLQRLIRPLCGTRQRYATHAAADAGSAAICVFVFVFDS